MILPTCLPPTPDEQELPVPKPRLFALALSVAVPALAGCAEQMLGNDRARGSISGTLGIPSSDATIVDRRADGPTNTNFIVDTKVNGRFICTINGGNIVTLGLTNGAQCRRPGAA